MIIVRNLNTRHRLLVVGRIISSIFIGLALLFFLFVPNLLWLGILLVISAAIIYRMTAKSCFRPTPINLLIFLFILYIPLTLVITPIPQAAMEYVGYLCAGIVAFVVLVNYVITDRRLWSVLIITLLAIMGLGLISPFMVDASKVDVSFIPTYLLYAAKALPETVNANVISGALAAWLPVMTVLVVRPLGEGRRRWGLQGVALITTVLTLFVLLVFRTRGVWMSLFVACLLVIFLRWRQLLVILPILIVAVILMGMNWLTNFASLLFVDDPFGGFEGRISIWSSGLSALHDFLLTGIGMGAWTHVIPLLYPYNLLAFLDPSIVIPHAHNLFLQVGVDLGVPGLITYIALMGLSVWMVQKAYRQFSAGAFDEKALLSLAVWVGLVIIMLHGIFDAVTWGTKPAIFAWALMALACVLYLQSEEHNASQAQLS